jgi:hypothetical protein
MKMQIKKFKKKDYDAFFFAWWKKRGDEVLPTLDMIPPTYWAIFIDDKPVASFGFLITNLKKVCYACHLVSNPDFQSEVRRKAVKALCEYVFSEAREKGFENMLAFSYQPKLTERFLNLGFRHTVTNLNSFCKSLEPLCR